MDGSYMTDGQYLWLLSAGAAAPSTTAAVRQALLAAANRYAARYPLPTPDDHLPGTLLDSSAFHQP